VRTVTENEIFGGRDLSAAPMIVQRALFGILARIARWRGYRAASGRY
jgi:hypothetical protein